jgi:hypothetical protein
MSTCSECWFTFLNGHVWSSARRYALAVTNGSVQMPMGAKS